MIEKYSTHRHTQASYYLFPRQLSELRGTLTKKPTQRRRLFLVASLGPRPPGQCSCLVRERTPPALSR